MSTTDDLLAQLLGRNSDLFTAYETWSNAQIMLLAGRIDDPDSVNASGGKTGALGYYPVVNVNGETVYVPSVARMQAIAAGATDPAVLENLLATQVAAAERQADIALQAKIDAQNAQTGAEAAASRLQPLPNETEWALGVEDTVGRFVGLLRPDGTFQPSKMKAPAASIDFAALAATILPMLLSAPVGGMFQALGPEQGGVIALVDQQGHIVFSVDRSGLLSLFKVILPAATIASIAAQASATAASNFGFQAMPLESGYAFAITDQNGRLFLGAPLSGTFAGGSSGADALAQDADYIVFGTVSATGKQILASQSKASGTIIPLTTAGDARAVELSNGIVTYRIGNVRYAIPAAGGAPRQAMATPSTYYCWGDSLTEGKFNSPYPEQLQTLRPGSTVFNLGISAQGTPQIVARQNGAPAQITVSADTIPSSGSVLVTAITPALLTSSAYMIYAQLTGVLMTPSGPVAGTLIKSAADTYSFQRATDGVPIACPAGAQFITDIGRQAANATWIIWTGRNDSSANYASVTQAGIASAVAADTKLVRQFLALGVTTLSDTTEDSGTTGFARIVAHNAALAGVYGRMTFGPGGTVSNIGRFLDVRRYLIDYGLALAGITPTSTDTRDIACDVIPSSLMNADKKHLSDAGYGVVAHMIDAALTAKGWK